MKVLIAYYSETGNTEKIARAIYEEASKDQEAHLKKVEEVTADTLNDYDLVFMGSACHSRDLAPPVKKILYKLPKSPGFGLAGFFTHGTTSPEDSFEGASDLFYEWAGKCITTLEKVSEEKQIDFRGYYHCLGVPSPDIQEFIRREIITSPDRWEEYMEEARKHPSPDDVRRAKEFAREVISKRALTIGERKR